MYVPDEHEQIIIDAAESKNAKLVNQLIKNGANVNSRNEGNGRFGHIALQEVASSGCLNAVKSLVSAGANLDLTDNYFEGGPPLVREDEDEVF